MVLLCNLKQRFSTTANYQVLPQMMCARQTALNCFLTIRDGVETGCSHPCVQAACSYSERHFFFFFLLWLNCSSRGFIQHPGWDLTSSHWGYSQFQENRPCFSRSKAYSQWLLQRCGPYTVFHWLLSQLCYGADEVGHNGLFITPFCLIGPSVCTHTVLLLQFV
jgi:hypothetical protein